MDADALIVLPSPMFVRRAQDVSWSWPRKNQAAGNVIRLESFVDAGGLMSYGGETLADTKSTRRDVCRQNTKGNETGRTLPVEQPTKFRAARQFEDGGEN